MRPPLLQSLILALSLISNGYSSETKSPVEEAIIVLEQNCIKCHNAEDAKGEIVLDRNPLGLTDPSLILEAISGSEPKMPKDADPLLDDEIATLTSWIESGAHLPEGRILKKTE